MLAALALSLALNALLLSRIDLSWLGAMAASPPKPVHLAALSAQSWEANRRVLLQPGPQAQPRPVPDSPPAPAPRPSPPDVAGQVVRIAPQAEPPREAPKDARFLSEQNSKVEKETRSRHARNEFTGSAPLPSAGKAQPPAEAPAGRPGARPDARPEAVPPSRAHPEQPRLALRTPGVGERPTAAPAPPVAPPERAPVEGEVGPLGQPGAGGRSGRLDLRPSPALVEALAGGPAANHLPDVEEGEGTFLNTREWRYAGYFNRIAQQLDVQWVREGRDQVAARDPTNQRFLYRDRLAVLDVTLDDHGGVKNVRVQRSTGVDFLDRIAMDMFKKSEQFANPPAGIVDARGEINFAFGINFVGATPSLGLLRRPAFHD